MKALIIVLVFVPQVVFARYCGTANAEPSNSLDRLIVDLNEEGEANLWKLEDRFNLTYCISDNFRNHKDQFTTALKQAIADWEAVANVKFVHVPKEDANCLNNRNPNVEFRVIMLSTHKVPYLAKAFFPYSPINKRRFVIQQRLVQRGGPRLKGIILHELGHILGFRHEHIHPDNEVECKEKAPSQPLGDFDPYSIMIYGRCGAKTPGHELSEGDKLGATLAYPFD